MCSSNIIWNIWLFVVSAIVAAGYTIAIYFKSDVLVWSVTLLLILLVCCTKVVREETQARGRRSAPAPAPAPAPIQVHAPSTHPLSIIIIQNPQNNLSIGYLQEATVKLNNPLRPSAENTIRDDPI